MAGKSRRSKLVLSDEDRAELKQLARSRTLPHREAQRAAIILGYYGGEGIASIGRRLGMTRLSVSKWVAKALAVGPMAALKDSYHRPKEPVIGDDAKAWVVHLACSKPKDLGYAAEVWSRQALAKHVREHAVQTGFPALSRAAKATVHRILAEQPLHPEKVKYYLERRDPDFEGGMRRVLIVYQDVALQNARRAAGETASNIITVSVDEKPCSLRPSAIPRLTYRLCQASIPQSAAITNTRDWVPVQYWQRSISRMVTSRRAWKTATAVSNSLACCPTSMRSIRLNAPSESYWTITPLTFLKRLRPSYRGTPTASSTSLRRNMAHG